MSINDIDNTDINIKDNINAKIPYYILGEIANNLNEYFLNISEKNPKKYNIIIKKFPQFIDWIEKSQSNIKQILNLYNFLRKRFEIYLPFKKIRNLKRILDNQQEGDSVLDENIKKRYKKLIKLYYELINDFKKIEKIFDDKYADKIEYTPYAYLYFMQGFDKFAYRKDEFIESWIENSFISDTIIYKLGFILGRYYYRAYDRETRLIGNLGLSKQLISWTKKLKSTNLLYLFKKINISYFHSLRKSENKRSIDEKNVSIEDKKHKLDNLSRYRKIIEDLFEELNKAANFTKKNNYILRLCFMCGFLTRTLPENLKRGKYENLSLPKDKIIELIYDLGALMRYMSEYELDKLLSHSFKSVIQNFKGMDFKNILNLILYISKILIRNMIKNASEFIKKRGLNNTSVEGNLKKRPFDYKYSNLFQRIILKFINLYDKNIKINRNVLSITFMLGYSYKGTKNKK